LQEDPNARHWRLHTAAIKAVVYARHCSHRRQTYVPAGNTVTSVRPLVPEFSFVLMKTCETLSAGDVIERPTSGDSEPHITTIRLEEYLGTPLIDVY